VNDVTARVAESASDGLRGRLPLSSCDCSTCLGSDRLLGVFLYDTI